MCVAFICVGTKIGLTPTRFDEGFVTLANDVKCRVVEIGISKIKV